MNLDAHLEPVIMNEFKEVGLFGAFPCRMHHDLHWPAIRQQSQVLVIALAKADLVKQGIGGIEVKLDPGVCILLAKQRTLRQDSVCTGMDQAEVNHLVNLITVNPQ